MKHVIGIDAGGSKTLALLVTETGEVVARSRAGGANPRSAGLDRAALSMREALEPLVRARPVDAICLGAAGLARRSDTEFFERTLREIAGTQPHLLLRNDAQIALEAGTSERPAMVAIAGTGSIVYGERADGSHVRCGGYGILLGDLPGGYAIGLRALRHAAATLDGLVAPGPLSEAVLSRVDASDVPRLVERVQCWPEQTSAIATLAALVADADARQDPAARTIVRDACETAREQIARVASQVRANGWLPVVIWGGMFDVIPDLCEAVEAGASTSGPCTVGRPTVEPAHGAALLALDALGLIRRSPRFVR